MAGGDNKYNQPSSAGAKFSLVGRTSKYNCMFSYTYSDVQRATAPTLYSLFWFLCVFLVVLFVPLEKKGT